MEQEIDLRPYIDVIVKYWKWVLGLTVVAVVAAALVSVCLLPPAYEAVATVLAIQPRYQMALAPEIESLVETRVPAEAYAGLAKNPQLQEQIIAALGDRLPGELRSVEALSELCFVSSPGDSSVILLKVRYRDAQVAADIANAWAALYVQQINSLYGQSEDDVQQIEAQIEIAMQNLQEAERALVEFQKTNPIRTLNEITNARTRALAAYLDAETSIQLALQDAQSLSRQLQAAGTVSPMGASSLSVLLTQLNALAAQHRWTQQTETQTQTQTPIQIQIQIPADASMADELSIHALVQYLEDLIVALEAKQQALVEAREGIPAELYAAQTELQRAQLQEWGLTRDRDVARDTHMALARKADELRIALQVQDDELRLVSPAPVPLKSVSRWAVVVLFLGGMLGLLVGIVGAFVREYSRKPGG